MPATPYLEFEKDIVEIQDQIQKLLDLAEDKGIDVASELGELRGRLVGSPGTELEFAL